MITPSARASLALSRENWFTGIDLKPERRQGQSYSITSRSSTTGSGFIRRLATKRPLTLKNQNHYLNSLSVKTGEDHN